MDLARFEAACFSRRYDEALGLLPSVLREVATSQTVQDKNAAKTPTAELATRLVSAIIALLLDPNTNFTKELFSRITPYLTELDLVMTLSGFGGGDHVLPLVSEKSSTGQRAKGSNGLAQRLRFHSFFSLNGGFDYDATKIFDEEPQLALLLLLRYLATKPILTPKAQESRERLLAASSRLQPAALPDSPSHLVMLSRAWMECSYASLREKHEVKRPLNEVIRGWLARRGLHDSPLPAERVLRERPVMVVPSERMHSNHVQYRYFGQWFRQLRQRFELILVTESKQVDAYVRPFFDSIYTFDRENTGKYLDQTVAFIRSKNPDVVFYPSVGMSHWGVVLANIRLAPIQFTALGHSASTFCPTVDYYAIERGYVGDPSLMSEKLILLEDSDLRFERSPHYQPVVPKPRDKPDPLRIVLAANLLKLNPAFLLTCAEIAKRSRRRVEFHIFPGSTGLEFQSFRRHLPRILPQATAHPSIGYNEYMRHLGACDLSLSPWPFGGLHSVVDAFRLGVPVVAMEGSEPHGRTDAVLIRHLKLPEWMICRDRDTYIATALRLIENDSLRLELSQQILTCDLENKLFGDATTPLDSGVIESIWGMYRHHERIQADPRQVWSRDDLAALDNF